jgi:hypothetical protein
MACYKSCATHEVGPSSECTPAQLPPAGHIMLGPPLLSAFTSDVLEYGCLFVRISYQEAEAAQA